MRALNFYKLAFGVLLFCYLSNEIFGGVVMSSENSTQEVSSGSPGSGKRKHSQPKEHNSSQHKHHNHNVQQIDLTVTQPTVLVVHQLVSVPKTPSGFASSGSPLNNPINGSDSSSPFKYDSSVSSELQTTPSSGYDASSSFKSDDLFSGLDASTESGSASTTHTEKSSSSEIPGSIPGSVEPDSTSGNVSNFQMDSSSSSEASSASVPTTLGPSISSPSSVIENGSSTSSEASSSSKSTPSASLLDSFLFWLIGLIRKVTG